uniref:Uncharacterized protein n=1 Tax=Amphimedon queenslandica TaxID=400682 RepID=A0A1X7VS16_AMPQE
MAYVGLSCVHTLNGLNLLSFILSLLKLVIHALMKLTARKVNFKDLPQIKTNKGKKSDSSDWCNG